MTKLVSADTKCWACAHTSTQIVHASVNVALDPALKERVVSGEIFAFRCPSCQHVTHAQYDCLYHDVSKALMLNLLSPEDADKTVHALAGALDALPQRELYTLRIVHSVQDLCEKIFIYDAELNDGIVELLKGLLPGQDEELKGSQLRFHTLDESGALVFAVVRSGTHVQFTDVPRDYYDAVRTKAFADLENATHKGGTWLRVDRNFVAQYLTNRNQRPPQ